MSRMSFYLKERLRDIEDRYSIETHESKILPPGEKALITWVAIMIFWLVITGKFEWQNFLVGGSVSLLVSIFLYENLTDDIRFGGNTITRLLNLSLIQIPQYLFIMAFQLIESNFKVAKHALLMDINPGIVRIRTPLRSDTGTTILANSITLTPGTLTMDVDQKLDKTYLYVHWIEVTTLNMEKAGDEIKGDVERWLEKIFW